MVLTSSVAVVTDPKVLPYTCSEVTAPQTAKHQIPSDELISEGLERYKRQGRRRKRGGSRPDGTGE